jgi:hypothetical protein
MSSPSAVPTGNESALSQRGNRRPAQDTPPTEARHQRKEKTATVHRGTDLHSHYTGIGRVLNSSSTFSTTDRNPDRPRLRPVLARALGNVERSVCCCDQTACRLATPASDQRPAAPSTSTLPTGIHHLDPARRDRGVGTGAQVDVACPRTASFPLAARGFQSVLVRPTFQGFESRTLPDRQWSRRRRRRYRPRKYRSRKLPRMSTAQKATAPVVQVRAKTPSGPWRW